jgi:cysteine desulfurase/selenocysteine lyase
MTTSNSADQRQDGRSAEPGRGVDVTRPRSEGDHGARHGDAPGGLPSEAELARIANMLYAQPPGGASVPTTSGQPGASGAPLSHSGHRRETATGLGVSEEERVHALFHPQSPSAPLHGGTPSQGSGGSAGGFGRSLPATSPTGGTPPFGREGFTPTATPVGSKSQSSDSGLLGSTATGSAIGLEPGRVRTLPQPYSAMPQTHTPSPPSGTAPSPSSGPQTPGHSRGGFGRPIPSTPDGAMAHSVPGAALSSQAGGPPIVGGPASATPFGSSFGAFPLGSSPPGASPLGATPINFSPLENFAQPTSAISPPQSSAPVTRTPSAPSGTLPSPNSGPQVPGRSRGGFGRPIPSTPDGAMAQSVPGAALSSQAGGPPIVGGPASATPFASSLGAFPVGASPLGLSPLGATPLNFTPPTNFTQAEDQRLQSLLPPCVARSINAPSSFGLPSSVGGAPAPSAPGAVEASPFYFLRERPGATAATASSPTNPSTAPYRSTGGMAGGHRVFDINAIRADFPILFEQVNGKQLVWFDNAATTQKPQAVIQRLVQFYEHENSNIHRAAHELAARATDAYEDARQTVARFINASTSKEIVFVRGTTEGINLVARSWGRQNVREGDEIVLTHLEHHANIVPWQFLAQETGARILVAPVDDSGQVRLDEYQRLMSRRTRIVAFPQVSNALGTVTPAGEMIDIAHRYGAKVLVDAAQSIAHMQADVQSLDADWLVFSGHKIFGPTGIGAVYGKQDLLNATLPWQGGGNMIERVTFEQSTFQPAPNRFEAGTGNIADAVGLGAALQYLEALGMDNISRYEHDLLSYAMDAMRSVNGLTLIGTAKEKASVLSFVLAGHDNEEVGKALNGEGIAVRAGHHCAQPILRRFGLETSVRPSLALYNTHEEVDRLVDALHHIKSGGRAAR